MGSRWQRNCPSDVVWLEDSLSPRPAVYVAVVSVIIIWSVALYFLATSPCPSAVESRICGWSWHPLLAGTVCVASGFVEVLILLFVSKRISPLQIGARPEGIVVRTGFGYHTAPWTQVDIPSVSTASATVLLSIRQDRKHFAGPTRRVRIPVSVAVALSSHRDRQFSRQ